MMPASRRGKRTYPSLELGLIACIATVIVWGVLRLGLFPRTVMPLTYALPLLICLWMRDKRMLWGMAAVFALMATVKVWTILPGAELSTFEDWAVWISQLINIGVAGAVVHLIINLNASLERRNEALQQTNAELETANEELAVREEEISRQNEELRAQSEELTQQNEELRAQGEELEQQTEELSVQSEELCATNRELARREQMLQGMLSSWRSGGKESSLLEEVCRRGMKLLGEDVFAVAVSEAREDQLRTQCAVGISAENRHRAAARTLARIVISEDRTAALDDVTLRPDLEFAAPSNGDSVRAALTAPLRSGRRAVGAVEFYASQARPWTADQFRLGEWVADQCAWVLEMGRLRDRALSSERENQAILDRAGVGIARVGLDGRFVSFNDRLCAITGRSPEALAETTFQQITHPDDLDRDLEQLAQLATGAIQRYAMEKRYLRPDGSAVWVHLTGSAVRGADGVALYFVAVVEDITARRAEEAERQASRRLLSVAMEAADLGTWQYTLADQVCVCGERAQRLYGLNDPRWDYTEAGVRAVLHSDDVQPMWKAVAAASDPIGDGRYHIEYRVRRPDGSWRWLSAWGLTEFEGDGPTRRAVRLIGASRDITSRKGAEQALLESEERHRLLSRTMLQGVVHQDADGVIVAMNPAAERILGKTREQFLGSTSQREEPHTVREDGSAFPGDDHPSMVALRSGQPQRGVVMGVWNPQLGERRWLDVSAVAVRRENQDRPHEVYTIFDDITERKKAVEDLAATTRRLEALLDALPVGVSFSNDPDCRVIQGNRAVLNQFGATDADNLSSSATDADAVGRHVKFRHEGRRIEPDDLPLQRAAKLNADIPAMEFEVELPGGRRWFADISAAPLRDAGGQVIGAIAVSVDITPRKLAEAELRESEERFRVMADGLPHIIWVHDSDGSLKMVNRAYLEFFAVTLEQVNASGWMPLVHPEDREPYVNEFAACMRDRRRFQAEARVRNAAGEWRWIASWGQPRFSTSGDFAGMVGASVDFTERKQAEDALRRSEATLTRAQQVANLGSWELDLTTGKSRWSDQVFRMLGLDPATVEPGAGTLMDLIEPADRELERSGLELAKTRGRYQAVYRVRVAGEVRTIQSQGDVDFDPAGTAMRIVGTIMDITERKAAEDSLRHSEERFRTLANNIAQFAWMGDADGSLTWYNQRWYDYTGTTPEQMIGFGWQQVHHPDHVQAVTEKFAAHVKAGETWEDTFPLRGKDGEYRWFLSRAIPIRDDSGKVVRWLGTNTDITRQRQTEQALESSKISAEHAKEAAETASRAKDQFMAVLSHELRTPLNPALMAATLLEQNPTLPPALHGDVSVIRRNIELEARLIDDMLDLTRIVRGKFSLIRRTVDVRDSVRHATETCQADAADKGVGLESEMANGPIFVDADPARLQQIFWNLIKNAIKFTDSGGRVTVRVRAIAGAAARVEVSDTGMGIEPSSLEKIFEAFEQAAPVIASRYGGLGLGLAICKGLVSIHDGTIRALSGGANTGATFIVELPPSRQAPSNAPPRASESANGPVGGRRRHWRILLVEDHDATAIITARLLRGQGHRVSKADSVKRALSEFSADQYDLVISDLGLPDGSGRDLLRQLLAMTPIKAIALSGYGMESDIQLSAEAGFLEHLVKPINPQQLIAAIHRVMGD